MSDAEEAMRRMSALMADARRSRLRVAGTYEQESTLKLAEALARGTPIVDMPYLNDGEIILAPEAVFMTAATRESFIAALEARK